MFSPSFPFLVSFSVRASEEEKMEKYLLNTEQLKQLMEKAIDLFLEYQYKRGYDEPIARSGAVMDVIGSLRALSNRPPRVWVNPGLLHTKDPFLKSFILIRNLSGGMASITRKSILSSPPGSRKMTVGMPEIHSFAPAFRWRVSYPGEIYPYHDEIFCGGSIIERS